MDEEIKKQESNKQNKKTNNTKTDLKKEKRKIIIPIKKLLLTLFFFFVIVFIIIIARRYIIYSKYAKDIKQYTSINNYQIKQQTYQGNALTSFESYYKDNIYLYKVQMSSPDTKNRAMTYYRNYNTNDHLLLIDSDNAKVMVRPNEDFLLSPPSLLFSLEDEGSIWQRLYYCFLTKSIRNTKCNGIECYEITLFGDTKIYIDKETSLTVREFNGQASYGKDYHYGFNKVTNQDIQKPDTTGYMLQE